MPDPTYTDLPPGAIVVSQPNFTDLPQGATVAPPGSPGGAPYGPWNPLANAPLTPEALAEIGEAMRQRSGVMTPGFEEGGQERGTGTGQWLRTLGQNLTFGWSDELMGLLGGDTEYERRRLAQHQAVDPSGAHGAALVGGALPMFFPAGWAARAVGTGAQIMRGAAAGGAAGFAYGAGMDEGDIASRIRAGATTGVPSAIVGGALPSIAPTIARNILAPARRIADDAVDAVPLPSTLSRDVGAAVPAIRREAGALEPPAIRRADQEAATGQPLLPTRDELHAEADAAFGRAEATGFEVAPTPFQDFANRLGQSLDGRISERIHPNSVGALEAINELVQSGQPLTLRRLLNLRETLGDAAGSQGGDGRLGVIIKNQFDDFFDGLTAEQVSMPNWWEVDTAMSSLDEGRTLWGRMRKVETIETLMDLAEDAVGANYTQAGLETAIRRQYGTLLRTLRRDSRQRALWTDDEFNLMETIVRGDSGWQNALRRLGSFAPRGAISTGFGLIGATTGNVPMMAATVAGEAARRLSTGITNRNVGSLDAMVRTGGAGASASGGVDPSLALFLLQQANMMGTPRLLEGAPMLPR